MIETAVLHSFLLVGPAGNATLLAVADMEEMSIDLVLDDVAGAVASRLTDEKEHRTVRDAAERAFLRTEDLPGTVAMAGERIPGQRLIRVFRHLAGENPME